MIAVVQAYINHRKGITVDINMEQFRDIRNVMLLNNAYSIAVEYFQNNKGNVIYIKDSF